MASPFKVFRKHQKLMLAGLTILAMFSFVFLGVISDLIGTRQTQNPVVVRTSKYGKLQQSDFSYMRWERMRVFAIMERMLTKVYVNINPQLLRQNIEYIFGTMSDEDLVDTWLKAKRAEELGMIVSNSTINDFIQNLSENKLSSQDIATIIRQEGLTENQFFDAMREQLRALQISQMFMWSIRGISPAQRWDYFCQLRKQASVELIPLAVEQFLGKTEDPSEAEVKAYFEQYKDKLPNPDSPKPGFRIPQKIDVEYFKADIEQFSAPAKITEEEIQNYYEKNREYFKQFEKEGQEELKLETKSPQEKEKAETPSAGEETQEQPKEQTKEQPQEKPGAEQKPAEQPAAPSESPPQKDSQKSSARERTPFRFTALEEQADKRAGEIPTAGQSQAAAPAAKEPARPEKAAAESAVAPQPGTAESATEKAAAKPAEATQPGTTEAVPEKAETPRRFISEKVREIVRAVAAREKINALFGPLSPLRQAMEDNGKNWRKYEAQKIHNEAAAPPAKLDFEGLAKKYGLTAQRTGLVSALDLRKLDIGSSKIEGLVDFDIAACKSLALFKAEQSVDTRGDGYLFWKVNETPEEAPSLDNADIRREVIRAWKMNRARDLALKEAEQLAETARKTDAPLKEVFADRSDMQVLAPAPFSFYSEGNVPRGSSRTAIRLAEVEGAPTIGADFMRAVFALEEKQIGTAMNAPKSVAYVIRLNSYSPPPDALWQIFLVDDFSKYSAAASLDLEQARQVWLDDLKTYAGLKWEPKPVQQQAAEQPTEDYYDE